MPVKEASVASLPCPTDPQGTPPPFQPHAQRTRSPSFWAAWLNQPGTPSAAHGETPMPTLAHLLALGRGLTVSCSHPFSPVGHLPPWLCRVAGSRPHPSILPGPQRPATAMAPRDSVSRPHGPRCHGPHLSRSARNNSLSRSRLPRLENVNNKNT